MNKTNELLQWIGAVMIVAGHGLNSLGYQYHGDFWNILCFALGVALFLIWSIRARNKPQATVNIISIIILTAGLFKSLD